jgi:hypothetical protein
MSVLTKLKSELLELLPPMLYFFVTLHLVVFVRVLMLKGTGLSPFTSVSVAVAALILGKAVFIADKLPLVNRFPEKPLIYNVAWKTAFYQLIAVAVAYLERLVEFSREAGGLVAGNKALLEKIDWSHFWGVQIVLFLIIVSYCTMHELSRVIGREKLMRAFFGPVPAKSRADT